MKTIWILLLVITHNNNANIQNKAYSSEAACKEAMKQASLPSLKDKTIDFQGRCYSVKDLLVDSAGLEDSVSARDL